ncbi:uncharacterized protein LOC111622667 [Centruroides sculpturatus]|uniref:uncharacterized protein LOC111622667 n=1 Tax=Centruroides sculpturatus TaxID=218467 RepID=UPI000C6D5F0D|nr:uncharacterized protein LOC111622667 [Centruroides sculpturatus]
MLHLQRADRPETLEKEQKERVSITYNPYLEKLYKEIAKKRQVFIVFRRGPTLFRLLSNAKDTPQQDMMAGVYSITIRDRRCDEELLYIGSTKRSLGVRIKEHKADILHKRPTTALAQYATDPEIQPLFDQAKIIYTTHQTQYLRLMEAIFIHKATQGNNCINSKDEISLSVAWQTLIYDT